MKHATLILYNSGSYGTYLEWALTTLMSTDDIVLPFTNVGNSHLFKGNQLTSPSRPEWHQQVNQNNFFQLARAHPKISEQDSIKTSVTTALESFDQIVFCYPDQNSILLNINNTLTKIWDNWVDYRLQDPVFAENLYNNWDIEPGTKTENIPTWIVREILSYNLIPSWMDEVEWFLPDLLENPKCKFVFITDLLYNFESVMLELQTFFNLDFKKEIKELIPCHSRMLSLQKHLNQDELCNNIVESIINSQQLSWNPLPLASQSWIQWKLRNLGYEIRCYGLDMFPTNSVNLQELIYKV